MTPYYECDGITIYVGDNRDVLPHLENISAVVTDPPYGLSFMGKDWDHSVPGEAFWRIIADAMKPGAHLLSFGGTRTFHRIAVAIEDAGLELRDTLMWLYGSGFPKSHDVSKAIDKAAGAQREVVGTKHVTRILDPETLRKDNYTVGVSASGGEIDITAPATPEAAQWAGWGTALKPSFEPVILARKPLAGTVAANVLEYGTGALNIDASRIGTDDDIPARKAGYSDSPIYGTGAEGFEYKPNAAGRWPANVILDEDAAKALDAQSGERPGCKSPSSATPTSKFRPNQGSYQPQGPIYGDTGGASRFFYCAKASRRERGEGNDHPTVKPLALMRYLITLITPPGGIVLDPFAGSGSTLVACAELGFPAIGIELSEEYAEIAARRVRHAKQQTKQAQINVKEE